MATKKKATHKKLFVGTALAGVAAAAAGYYFYGPKGKQHRTKIQSWTLKAHADVMEQVEKLKEIDRKSFDRVIDGAVSKYTKGRKIAAKEAAEFANDLKKQWAHVEKEFDSGAARGKKTVKKVTKKVAKKVKKVISKK